MCIHPFNRVIESFSKMFLLCSRFAPDSFNCSQRILLLLPGPTSVLSGIFCLQNSDLSPFVNISILHSGFCALRLNGFPKQVSRSKLDFRSKYQDLKRSLLFLTCFELYVMPADHSC